MKKSPKVRPDPSRNLDREKGRPVTAADVAPHALPLHSRCRRGIDRKTGQVCKCATKRFLRAHPEVVMDAEGNAWWPKKVSKQAAEVERAIEATSPKSWVEPLVSEQIRHVLGNLSSEGLRGVMEAAEATGQAHLLKGLLPDARREDTVVMRTSGPASIASGLDACCDRGLAAKVEAIAAGRDRWACPVHAGA